MVILAVDRVFLQILKGVVHPAHVPLEQEAQAILFRGHGDQREGMAFFRHHDGALTDGKAGGVQLAQKFDAF